ncbi:hypothetical protein [Rhizobium sp. CCGE 510]|uniref:hypothetical protein n=1 Tax=Rhizobium sp. CCGE 510 TaxID=1132836 RepID=UPI00027B7DD1|nr:hypothetical protein [Rhizobium sp. CCGE 510]EJT06675.1 hypothetical protein RCCGE510_02738 [Rhizobium sp. CCGE 510]
MPVIVGQDAGDPAALYGLRRAGKTGFQHDHIADLIVWPAHFSVPSTLRLLTGQSERPRSFKNDLGHSEKPSDQSKKAGLAPDLFQSLSHFAGITASTGE